MIRYMKKSNVFGCFGKTKSLNYNIEIKPHYISFAC